MLIWFFWLKKPWFRNKSKISKHNPDSIILLNCNRFTVCLATSVPPKYPFFPLLLCPYNDSRGQSKTMDIALCPCFHLCWFSVIFPAQNECVAMFVCVTSLSLLSPTLKILPVYEVEHMQNHLVLRHRENHLCTLQSLRHCGWILEEVPHTVYCSLSNICTILKPYGIIKIIM